MISWIANKYFVIFLFKTKMTRLIYPPGTAGFFFERIFKHIHLQCVRLFRRECVKIGVSRIQS